MLMINHFATVPVAFFVILRIEVGCKPVTYWRLHFSDTIRMISYQSWKFPLVQIETTLVGLWPKISQLCVPTSSRWSLELPMYTNQLSSLVLECLRMVGCGFKPQLGHTKFCKNRTHCLPAWPSVFRVGPTVLDQRMIPGCSTAAAHWVKCGEQI